ncbi:hypothetical protein P7H60_11905 [Vagococcus carniphilus]|uniref:YobI family P-loop NTPase n=1 Tax=Vagococcus carniphilus TaxID=218144 RepID=UPI00288CA2DD|nr:hypothetical protein [Vagococcus carniphilus]MDT2849848.1 hypothetical protein [Vagococcus carniphilus]
MNLLNLFWIVLIVVGLVIVYYINKNYKKILVKIKKLSSDRIDKINKRVDSEEEMFKQNSLAPKLLKGKELEKIQPYIDRLDESVRMPNVNNVALMSSYGAGKSTILRNFENQHDEYNYLNLSLGSYSTKEKEETIDNKGNKIVIDLNEKLENSLVKQMIYREKKSKLPYSRFKKINSISKVKVFTFLILEFFSVISFLFLKDFLKLQSMLKVRFHFTSENMGSINFICYLVFLLGIFFILYIIIDTILKQFKLSKLSVGNISIEGNENSISYFNKYIDEILYYFEINKFNVVVIEDVDRFGTIKVFEHLKELNILLNNSKQINRKITFIYAIKEDIFSKIEEGIEEHESELRTKFFELIIPVIPVIDGFNSRDYLIPLMIIKEEMSEKEKLEKKLPITSVNEKEVSQNQNEEKVEVRKETIELKGQYTLESDFELFLSDISLHIQDLRLLNNIVNEYYTFIDVHGKISESFDKKRLFSLITLKNLVPSAYTDLQKSVGLLYKALATDEYDGNLIFTVNQDLEKLEEELQVIQKDMQINKSKEAKLFFFEEGASSKDKIYTNNQWIELSQIKIDMLEKIISEEIDNQLMLNPKSGSTFTIDTDRLAARIKEPSSTLQKKVNDKNIEIKELRNRLGIFQRLSLQDKLNEYPKLADKLFVISDGEVEKDIPEKDFFLFLVSNGYLAEDYSSYLSIFYEGTTLTANDKNLLVKLKSNQSIDFEEEIFDSSIMVKNLSIKDFERRGILNANMLLYLFSNEYEDKYNIRDSVLYNWFNQNEEVYLEQLEVMINKKDNAKLIYKMVEQFSIEFFIKSKDSMKSDLVNLILSSTINEKDYFETNNDKLLFTTLNRPYYQNEPEPIAKYLIKENILARPNFFKEVEKYINKKKLIAKLGSFNSNNTTYEDARIYFEDIDMKDLNSSEFDLFIELKLFAYNTEMLSSIINFDDETEVKKISYANILEMKNDKFTTIIQDNLDVFIRDIFLNLDLLSETEESFIEMLNLYDEESSINVRYKELIKIINVQVEDLSKIENETLWNHIFEYRKYKLNWKNLMTFNRSEKVDLEYVRKIFNDSSSISELQTDYLLLDDETKSKVSFLLKDLVGKNEINVNEKNIGVLGFSKYDAFNLKTEEAKLLIKHDLVIFDIETINEFREIGLKAEVLLNYQHEYIENSDKILLVVEEMIKLVKGWNKSDIIRLIDVLFDKEFNELLQSEEFINTLLTEKIKVTDEQMNTLIRLNSEIKTVKEYFLFNMAEGVLNEDTISNTLHTIYNTAIETLTPENFGVIFNTKLDSEQFVNILNFAFRHIGYTTKDYKMIEGWLGKQDSPFNELFIDGRMREVFVEQNSETETLLENLKTVGIVSSYKQKEENLLSVYVKRNKPSKEMKN